MGGAVMAPRIKQAAEIIADHLGSDIADVRDMAYRRGHTAYPLYSIGEETWCCPPAGRKPPQDYGDRSGDGYEWRVVATVGARTIYAYGGEVA